MEPRAARSLALPAITSKLVSPYGLDVTNERRRAPRLNVNLPVRWEGVLMQQSATVTSLSESGCFILSGGKVELRK